MSLDLATNLTRGLDDYIYRVVYEEDPSKPPINGHGGRLTRLCDAVQAWNEGIEGRGRRHVRGWKLVLRGQLDIKLGNPWHLRASRVAIDGHGCQLIATGEPPVIGLNNATPVEPGATEIPTGRALMFRPGDIVLGPDGFQVPIRSVERALIKLAYPYPGTEPIPLVEAQVSTGRVVTLQGEAVSFPEVIPIYCQDRWDRGQRHTPVSVVETAGWDLEDGFYTQNFDHPGDYAHVNSSLSPRGGTNGCIYTGGSSISHAAIAAHGQLLTEGQPIGGAAYLLMANTVKTAFRVQMQTAFRQYLLVGGHKMGPLEMSAEGCPQLIWAPTGVSHLYAHAPMNHQNSPSVPRDLPLIDLGHATGNKITHFILDLPFVFFQWGHQDREAFIHATGNPVYGQVRANLRNFQGRAVDVPIGSVVHEQLTLDDSEGGLEP